MGMMGGMALGGLFGMFGAATEANAAQNAAQIQAGSAQQGINAMTGLGQQSLAFQQQQWQQAQANTAPWLGYGRGAVEELGNLMGIKPDYPAQVGATGTAPSQSPAASVGAPSTGPNNRGPSGGGQPTSYLTSGPNGSLLNNDFMPYDPVTGYNWQGTRASTQGVGPQQASSYQTPGPDWNSFFSGNPGGAFTGGTPGAGGDQNNQGGVNGHGEYSKQAARPQPLQTASTDTVHIVWPNGVEADIPSYQADQYQSMGAKVSA